MSPGNRFSIIALIAVILAGVLTRVPVLSIGSVQPDLVLAVLVAAALFTRNTAFFALLTGLAVVFARATPFFFDAFSLATAVAAFIIFAIKQRVVWPDRLGVLILTALGSLITYAIAAPHFIVAHPGLLALETVATIIVSILCFELFTLIAGRRQG